MDNTLTTEHTIPYLWKTKVRFMVVKRTRSGGSKFYTIRTKKGEFVLQYFDSRWNIISPRHNRFDHQILNAVGNAILDSGL